MLRRAASGSQDSLFSRKPMSTLTRRDFVKATVAGLATPWLVRAATEDHAVSELQLAPFRFDVSPPIGHSCCGGWIQPVVGYDDPQEAIGFVLLGAGAPVVICALDWTGVLNEAHVAFRTALA